MENTIKNEEQNSISPEIVEYCSVLDQIEEKRNLKRREVEYITNHYNIMMEDCDYQIKILKDQINENHSKIWGYELLTMNLDMFNIHMTQAEQNLQECHNNLRKVKDLLKKNELEVQDFHDYQDRIGDLKAEGLKADKKEELKQEIYNIKVKRTQWGKSDQEVDYEVAIQNNEEQILNRGEDIKSRDDIVNGFKEIERKRQKMGYGTKLSYLRKIKKLNQANNRAKQELNKLKELQNDYDETKFSITNIYNVPGDSQTINRTYREFWQENPESREAIFIATKTENYRVIEEFINEEYDKKGNRNKAKITIVIKADTTETIKKKLQNLETAFKNEIQILNPTLSSVDDKERPKIEKKLQDLNDLTKRMKEKQLYRPRTTGPFDLIRSKITQNHSNIALSIFKIKKRYTEAYRVLKQKDENSTVLEVIRSIY